MKISEGFTPRENFKMHFSRDWIHDFTIKFLCLTFLNRYLLTYRKKQHIFCSVWGTVSQRTVAGLSWKECGDKICVTIQGLWFNILWYIVILYGNILLHRPVFIVFTAAICASIFLCQEDRIRWLNIGYITAGWETILKHNIMILSCRLLIFSYTSMCKTFNTTATVFM